MLERIKVMNADFYNKRKIDNEKQSAVILDC
jgi:hypothetical protein